MNLSPEAIAAREAYFEEKRKKKKITPVGVSNADVELALRKTDGNISEAANFLGVSHRTVRNRIQENENLQSVLSEVREAFLDLTESELRKGVKAGNASLIMFVLKTLGRNRGYVEKVNVEHDLGPYAARNAANLIEAMKKAAKEAPALPEPVETIDGTYVVEETVDAGGEL